MVLSCAVAAALVAISPEPSVQTDCETPSKLWKVSKTAPPQSREHPVNIVTVDGEQMSWNGVTVPESKVLEYLGFVATMPPNITVLAPKSDRDCAILSKLRKIMTEQLACTPANCVEVVP